MWLFREIGGPLFRLFCNKSLAISGSMSGLLVFGNSYMVVLSNRTLSHTLTFSPEVMFNVGNSSDNPAINHET